jgi:hypothetical protein
LTTTFEEVLGVRVDDLKPTDTCDATASGTEAAVVRVANDFGDVLDLCAHHFAAHETALDFHGYIVRRDNRSILTKNYKGQAGE